MDKTSFPCLYEDEFLVVIDKPAGITIFSGGWGSSDEGMVAQLQPQYGRLWVVHRLDKTTSGVIVFARSAESHRRMNTLFETHQVKKEYHAILVRCPEWKEIATTRPLRVNVGHSHKTVVDLKQGKAASTRFKVLKSFIGHALVEAFPLTGRTHQIRIHASDLGFPLLADFLYGSPATTLINRPALHAHLLSFLHPMTNQPMTFESKYPADFRQALALIQ